MAATKKETVLDFLNNAYNEYHFELFKIERTTDS
jgi:hypothetical protein